MKYSAGQKVRIKSLDWYNKNKDKYGQVFGLGATCFNRDMSRFCGSVLTIDKVFDKDCYRMKEDYSQWRFTDGMIEGLVEDTITTNEPLFKLSNISLEKEMEWNLPDGYIFKDENGNVINATKIVLEKKKKEYPKTYEECCKIIYSDPKFYVDTHLYSDTLEALYKLFICRDAYWMLYGEEMGLGKPWKPKLDNNEKIYYIHNVSGKIYVCEGVEIENQIFAFPTAEMRDAFKENFDPDIDFCKELL